MGEPLRTERLTLRSFRSDDLAAFSGFANGDDYLRFLGPGHPDASGWWRTTSKELNRATARS